MTAEAFWTRIAGVEDSLAAGGPVMIPLAAVSLVMWTLIINRALFFARLYRRNMSRAQAAGCIRENRAPDFRRFRGAMALLVGAFQQRRTGRPSVDRQILDETVMSLVSALDAHLALIGVLASVAPLLGLLGTVTGMIATFDTISVYGTGNAKAMAGGISEALITTQTGLLVAIPGLYMRNFLARRSERLKQRIAGAGMYLRRFI
jgi:biopolymer transport protein ExbB